MYLYSFALDQFHIDNTRSRHEDTDTVTFGLRIGEQQFPIRSRFVGDVNNGDHAVGMVFPLVLISDGPRPVVFTYVVYNGDASKLSINLASLEQQILDQTVNLVLDTLAANGVFGNLSSGQVSGDIPPDTPAGFPGFEDTSSWETAVVEIVLGSIASFIFPDCDGFVAGDAIGLSKQQWDVLIDSTGGVKFGRTMSYPGTDSPAGCGSNSQYSVTWSVTRERVHGSVRSFLTTHQLSLQPGLRSLAAPR